MMSGRLRVSGIFRMSTKRKLNRHSQLGIQHKTLQCLRPGWLFKKKQLMKTVRWIPRFFRFARYSLIVQNRPILKLLIKRHLFNRITEWIFKSYMIKLTNLWKTSSSNYSNCRVTTQSRSPLLRARLRIWRTSWSKKKKSKWMATRNLWSTRSKTTQRNQGTKLFRIFWVSAAWLAPKVWPRHLIPTASLPL